MSAATSLFVADAEPETHRLLSRQLPQDGFRLVGATGSPDLVLAGDVASVAHWAEHVPVIVLGHEQADSVDRIRAFRHGCDDYLVPPFDYQELVERIRAVLRRVRPPAPPVVEAARSASTRGRETCASRGGEFGSPRRNTSSC